MATRDLPDIYSQARGPHTMATRDLPDIYAQATYISGKSLVAMVKEDKPAFTTLLLYRVLQKSIVGLNCGYKKK